LALQICGRAEGDTQDVEHDHDGREPGEDDERSTGWTDRESATGR
jgi:hypothetical protein